MTIPRGEKQSAALYSVIAAIALTAFKLLVGLSTNSLGILAEAAHSGLDLAAAAVTLMAVNVSARPPDAGHHYGHGKVENLSALFETLLLLVTCAWIVYESAQRLLFKSVQIDASIWAFIVMICSIVVDYSRSRNLSRAAKKYRSQALEADALHFSTDIWSSAVVIIGLVVVRLGESRPELPQMTKADSLAALMVAGIVIYVSARLGRRTVQGILDHAPQGLREKIKQSVESLPGVYDCHDIRVRTSGAKLFVDMHVLLDSKQSLEDAHRLTEDIEVTVKRLVPDADVTVHAEPIKQ
ncbi:MAG: cation diffusion facilitator family transporter [Candidatus Bathyarchaeia archaeon]|jgi:cation diffusion facilitator family transporter